MSVIMPEIAFPEAGPSNSGLNAGSVGSVSAAGVAGLTNLGGYLTGSKKGAMNGMPIRLRAGEALLLRESTGYRLQEDGKVDKGKGKIEWDSIPDELGTFRLFDNLTQIFDNVTAYRSPFLYALLPPPLTTTTTTSKPVALQPSITVHSSHSLAQLAHVTFPVSLSPISTRIMSPSITTSKPDTSPISSSPIWISTSPSERKTELAEGSTIWYGELEPWNRIVGDLVDRGFFAEGIAIVERLSEEELPSKGRHQQLLETLHAVTVFRSGEYQAAIEAFIRLSINPALVIALYPSEISGRLAEPEKRWIELFGGPALLGERLQDPSDSASVPVDDKLEDTGGVGGFVGKGALATLGALGLRHKPSLDGLASTVRSGQEGAAEKPKEQGQPVLRSPAIEY